MEKTNTTDPVRAALQLAIRQNEHDMLMTGEELRQCRAALAQQPEAPAQEAVAPAGAVWIMPVATDSPQNSNLMRMAWGASALSTGELANAYDSIVSAARRCGQVLAQQPAIPEVVALARDLLDALPTHWCAPNKKVSVAVKKLRALIDTHPTQEPDHG